MSSQAQIRERSFRHSPSGSDGMANQPHKDATGLPVMDVATFEARVGEWVGKYRAQMLAEGYATTEEWMNDVRRR